MVKGEPTLREGRAQRGEKRHAMRLRGVRQGLRRPAGGRAGGHLRPRRGRSVGQLLLDTGRHRQEDAVDRPQPHVEPRAARHAGGPRARRGQVPVRNHLAPLRQRRGDPQPPRLRLPWRQAEATLPVAVEAETVQRQRPRGGSPSARSGRTARPCRTSLSGRATTGRTSGTSPAPAR